MVVGEVVSLEEMGGARMHATVSGCGDNLASDDADAIASGPLLLLLFPDLVALRRPGILVGAAGPRADRGAGSRGSPRSVTTCTPS